ncbi:metal ABC transporter permease [Gemella sp. GH3]|uniref:metal ABC transporter permease n=1 Tax=unclassified Gemella TaxID=2624949 RepID=UPI0015CFA052|nr:MULTISPECIES: metal ABC transporter permease [unclassified Gemella]MBF0713791.1 metal ABC transporter permease [Gemella sp. GH3.1]NYS50743.1 metal ABC transporter permease [Gemella sp. GH3]
MTSLLQSYTFQIVALGATLLGAVCGAVGVFSVLKKESLIGDVISHSALPGICLAYIITREKDLVILLLGALGAGLLANILISYTAKKTSIKLDNILALVLSMFFGLGIVLLTYIKILPGANKAGLNKFIFGQAAAILKEDIYLISGISIVVLIVLIAYWYKLKLVIFDYTYAKIIYKNKVRFYELLLSFLTVICIVIGLEMVGVILMSSLIIVPAVSARQWTDNLVKMTIISAFVGGISGLLGTVISSSSLNLPTGPVIVILLSFFVLVSLVFSPKRGILRKYLYKKQEQEKIIKDMLKIANGREN